MVGKLMKHELFNIFRVAIFPVIVMLLLAVVCRVTLLVASDSAIIWILVMFYGFAILATLCVCGLIGVSRFYKTFFTGEGYMTMSLPVTPDQLIWAELLSSIIALFFGVIACALSTCIFLVGAQEEIGAIAEEFYFYGEYLQMLAENDPLKIFETIVLIIVSVPAVFLEFFFVMSIGQLVTVKNRKGIAVGLYILIAFVWSILSQIVWYPLLETAAQISEHLSTWLTIIGTAAIDLICYFVVRYILKNKVNLVA